MGMPEAEYHSSARAIVYAGNLPPAPRSRPLSIMRCPRSCTDTPRFRPGLAPPPDPIKKVVQGYYVFALKN
jgi:hypothetical protein